MKRRTNIHPHGAGKRANVYVNGKQLFSPVYALDTPDATIEKWIADQRKLAGVDPGEGMAADIEHHLAEPAVQAVKPTYRQRCDHLRANWLPALREAFGRPFLRNEVTPRHINTIIAGWLEGLAPATVRKRCVYLQSFYTDRNGPEGPNPMWGANVPAAPKPSDLDPDALDYADIERALAAMPDWISTKPGAPRVASVGKIVARIMAYQSIPPAVLNAIQPRHVSLNPAGEKYPHGWVRVPGREKGAGTSPRKLPLTADANAAFRDWHAHDCYGRVPVNVGRTFVAGWARAGLPAEPMVFYRLRHSCLTRFYEQCGDSETVGRMGLHAPGSPMIARYTKAGHEAVNAHAAVAFSKSLDAERTALAKPPRVVNAGRGRR